MTREVCYRHQNVVGLTAASFYEAEFTSQNCKRKKRLSVMPFKEACQSEIELTPWQQHSSLRRRLPLDVSTRFKEVQQWPVKHGTTAALPLVQARAGQTAPQNTAAHNPTQNLPSALVFYCAGEFHQQINSSKVVEHDHPTRISLTSSCISEPRL